MAARFHLCMIAIVKSGTGVVFNRANAHLRRDTTFAVEDPSGGAGVSRLLAVDTRVVPAAARVQRTVAPIRPPIAGVPLQARTQVPLRRGTTDTIEHPTRWTRKNRSQRPFTVEIPSAVRFHILIRSTGKSFALRRRLWAFARKSLCGHTPRSVEHQPAVTRASSDHSLAAAVEPRRAVAPVPVQAVGPIEARAAGRLGTIRPIRWLTATIRK